MIDIHCHILPGIDDGPATLEAALALAQAMAADGITHAVLTPHVFPGRFENQRTSIELDFKRFADSLKAAEIALSISWAGEVRLTPEVLDMLARKQLPFLGQVAGFKTMLLEMPDGQIPLGSDRFVRHLLAHGVRPVIVHPERNRAVMEQPERLRGFIEQGCYLQVTAGSLVGQFGPKALATATALLDLGWVHAVASDAHNLTSRRPRMREAAAWLTAHYDDTLARQLTVSGPAGLCGQGPTPGQGLAQAAANGPQAHGAQPCA